MKWQQENNDDLDEKEAFMLLYNMYAKCLKRKAYSILKDDGWAEDAVQCTFMKLLRHMDNIDDPLSDRSKHYLYTILVNSCYTIIKKNNKYYLMDDDTMQIELSRSMVERDKSTDHLFYEDLIDELKKIPELYSNLMILHAVYNYSIQDISEMLELKPATVRKRLERCRKMLNRIIKK